MHARTQAARTYIVRECEHPRVAAIRVHDSCCSCTPLTTSSSPTPISLSLSPSSPCFSTLALSHSHTHLFYRRSLEDIVSLTIVRAAVLSIVYAVGMRHMHRPYLCASYLLAAMSAFCVLSGHATPPITVCSMHPTCWMQCKCLDTMLF